jgi:flagellar basal-body rod protein FlgB
MTGKLEETLGFHASAIAVRAERQQVIASNIANADTPHYRAKDLDFAAALRDARNGRSAHATLVRTSSRHMQPPPELNAPEHVVYRTARQPSADGNTVELDRERAQFASNALHYEANLTFLTMQIKGLLTAIQG